MCGFFPELTPRGSGVFLNLDKMALKELEEKEKEKENKINSNDKINSYDSPKPKKKKKKVLYIDEDSGDLFIWDGSAYLSL